MLYFNITFFGRIASDRGYAGGKPSTSEPKQIDAGHRVSLPPDDTTPIPRPSRYYEEGYRGLLLAPGRSADERPRSPQSLRTHAVAESATDCVYARVVAAPQATAEPFNLSLFVPATRARRLVRRVQLTTREVNAWQLRRATLIEINLFQLQGRLVIWGNFAIDTIISVYIFRNGD